METERMSTGSLQKLTQCDLPTLVIQHETLLKAHILSHIIFRLEDLPGFTIEVLTCENFK